MSGRTWQMLAAGVSVAIMVVVLVDYGQSSDDAGQQETSRLHTGPAPLTHAKPGVPGKPAHEGGALSPIQVYEHAKIGDWRAYRVRTESSFAPAITATAITRIAEADDTKIVRSIRGRLEATGEVRDDRDVQLPRTGLTIDQLTGNDIGGWTIYDLAITDEDHTIGGRTFKCKKLTYASKDPLIESKRTHTEVWISAEVPVGGLVELREVQVMPNMRFQITQTLVGFGDATTTTWGDKPEGL